MRLSFILLLAAVFCFENLQAQFFPSSSKAAPPASPLGVGGDFCGQNFATHRAFRRSPELLRQHLALEKRAYDFFKKRQNHPQPLKGSQSGSQTGSKMADYVLPVVVHLIHQNGSENISDAQVLQGIQDLNDAFANLNYYDPATGVDTKIQFCLAKRNPDGNATTGINRVVSPLTNLDISQDLAAKDLSRWNPYEYVNIWLVREICNGNGCSVAGYAYFPSSHGQPQDGLMMEAKWFGSNPGNSSVIAHEMGHYLGLYHTFDGGCTNADCLADGDQVCDTPPDNSTAPVPCDQSMNSCTSDNPDLPDMFWNFMDYGDWDCYADFTQGQTERMHFFIEEVRGSLLDSKGCENPCLSPISAAFAASATTVNVGSTVNFTNASTGGTSWQWLLDGVPFASTANASQVFNALGTFVVTLQAANADPNCGGIFSDTIKVVCPVNASFTTSNLYPLPGETVNFTNATAGGATSYAWTVNGTAAGTAGNFSYQIPAEGVFTICLQAGNGLCGDGFCQVVFAFEPVDTGCVGTFIRRIGSDGLDEKAHAVLPTPDGNFLIGGSRDNRSLLMLVSAAGEPIWERTFDFTGGDDFIRNMLLDSDGMLVANGRDQYNVATLNFTFRYDWQTNTLLWSRQMPNPAYTRLEGILENPANGNFVLLGLVENPSTSLDNVVFEVNRNTGLLVYLKSFDTGSTTDVYYAGTVYENELYLTGNQRFGDLDKIRTSVSRLNLDGDQQWTRIYLRNPNTTARLYGEDIHVENDTVVVLSRGSMSDDNLFASTVQLFKTDPDGELYWAKNYAFSGGNTAVSRSIMPLPDGYVLQGNLNLTGGTRDFFFIRTDKQGNVLWSKLLGGGEEDECWSALFHDNFIYFVASSSEGDVGGSENVIFGRMSLDGEVSGVGCDFVKDLTVTASTISNAYDGQHDLAQESHVYAQNSTTKTPTEVSLEATDLLGCECEEFESDSCSVAPDALIAQISALCEGDSLAVLLNVCNDSAGVLTQGTPITFYLGNPTTAVAQVLTTQILPQNLLSGDCISFPVKLATVPANAAVFVMVNDDGTTPTPWNFDDFPNTSLFECNFPNNLDSFTIAYSPPTLDLGGDVVLCHFATATFDAGAGFASYTWHDGSHEQTFTAWEPGTFWVTTVDSCGGVQTDSVTVSIEPGTIVEIGVDSAKICEGGSLNFAVGGFDHYAWSPAGWLDCDTCASVTAAPDSSGNLILVASTDDGCFSVDTVQIQLLPPQATAETIEFCPGTSVIIFGNPVSVEGDYSQTFSDLNGCDSTHTITLVEVTDTALIVDEVVICTGDSVEFFGEWVSVSGTFDHFEPIGNCVQHNQLVLQVLPLPVVILKLQPPTCFGFSDASLMLLGGQGNLQFSLDGVNWQAENVFDSLGVGSYEVFVLDENGCQFQAEFVVNDPPQVFVQLPPDVTIEWGDTLTIEPNLLQNNLLFSWTPPDWLSCIACQNPVAQPEDTILYVLTVADPGGCSASDSIQINVELTKAVYVPNVFTPNGDGINEHFYIFGKGISEVRLLRIFDRWGELVFEAKNIPANEEGFGWDGEFRGKPMNSEVFAWYAIVTFVDGTETIRKGDLTLLR